MSERRDGSVPEVTVASYEADDDRHKVVIDVREPYETARGTVAGAMLVPLGRLQEAIDDIDDEANVYLICRSGNRSRIATQILLEAGKRGVKNVSGGMLAWEDAGLPISR